MVFVDTNVLLRWLLGDHKTLSPKAEKLIDSAGAESLIVTDIVVAEIVYVLRGTGRDRQQTAEALLLVERTDAFRFENPELVMDILSLLTDTTLDFADCYLLARAKREKTGLLTFDQKMLKHYGSR